MFLFLFPAPASPRRRGGGRARDWLSARAHRNAAAAAGAEAVGLGRAGAADPVGSACRPKKRALAWHHAWDLQVNGLLECTELPVP